VESPPAPKCAATRGGDNERNSAGDRLGVDGKRYPGQVLEGASRPRSARACRLSLESLAGITLLTILQLRDVAKGVHYLHSQGIVHGNLAAVRLQWSELQLPGYSLQCLPSSTS